MDINPFAGAELWLHLLDRWPLPDESIETVYIRHCLEHFSEREVLRVLGQCQRVLAPNGGVRIGVPSLEFAVEEYVHGDFAFVPWVAETSISQGRRFFRYIMDDGNHGIAFDYGYLHELLTIAGFQNIQRSSGGSTQLVDPAILAHKDNENDVATLYVECRKPSLGVASPPVRSRASVDI